MTQIYQKNGKVNLGPGGVLQRPTPVTLFNTKSVAFDGIDDEIIVTRDASLEPDQITVSAWVKFDVVPVAVNPIIGKMGNYISHGGYFMHAYRYTSGPYTGTSRITFGVRANPGPIDGYAVSNDAIQADVWYHLVGTYDNLGNNKLHIDGVEQDDFDTFGNGTINYNDIKNFYIGRLGDNYTTLYLDGVIDEVSIWNTALDTSQITELYNGGSPKDLTTHPAYANCISWWRLGDDPNDYIDQDTPDTGNIQDVRGLYDNHGTPRNMDDDALNPNIVTDVPS